MKITLCGRPNACCPTVELLPDGVTIEIEFDDGESTQMTKSEFENFKEQISKLNIKDL